MVAYVTVYVKGVFRATNFETMRKLYYGIYCNWTKAAIVFEV